MPVFLTRNGVGDTVIMDVATYNKREDDLAAAERLLSAELARLQGVNGYTVDEFEQNMRAAIKRGAAHGRHVKAYAVQKSILQSPLFTLEQIPHFNC